MSHSAGHASSSRTTLDGELEDVEISSIREDEPLLSSRSRRLHGNGFKSYSSGEGSLQTAVIEAEQLDDDDLQDDSLEAVWKDVEEGHGHGHGE